MRVLSFDKKGHDPACSLFCTLFYAALTNRYLTDVTSTRLVINDRVSCLKVGRSVPRSRSVIGSAESKKSAGSVAKFRYINGSREGGIRMKRND